VSSKNSTPTLKFTSDYYRINPLQRWWYFTYHYIAFMCFVRMSETAASISYNIVFYNRGGKHSLCGIQWDLNTKQIKFRF